MNERLKIACPECGKDAVIDGKCTNCGYVLWEADTTRADRILEERNKARSRMQEIEQRKHMTCPHCGSNQVAADGFCRNCGYGLVDADYQEQVPLGVSYQFTGNNYQPPAQSTNLANCPDCGHLVSMYATSCPGCGRPLVPLKQQNEIEEEKPREKKSGSGGVFFAVVFGIIVAVWIISKIFHFEITGTIVPIK